MLTPARAQKEARNKKAAKLYKKLVANGAMKTAAEQAVMTEFNIKSRSSIWKINNTTATGLAKTTSR